MKWRSLEEQNTEQASRTLHELYAERKELIRKYVPADVQEVHSRVIAELQQSGIAERVLHAGDAAPDFELPDHNGELFRSSDRLDGGPLVLCFIRGRWCPFCVGQLEAMNAIASELRKLGASLAAISPQTIHQSFLTVEQHRLEFPMLSDSGNHVARQFGLVYRVPEYQQEIYRRVFINLPAVNGEASWELPIPGTYVIGTKHPAEGAHGRRILYASANPDYTERPEPTEVLHFLSQPSSQGLFIRHNRGVQQS